MGLVTHSAPVLMHAGTAVLVALYVLHKKRRSMQQQAKQQEAEMLAYGRSTTAMPDTDIEHGFQHPRCAW